LACTVLVVLDCVYTLHHTNRSIEFDALFLCVRASIASYSAY